MINYVRRVRAHVLRLTFKLHRFTFHANLITILCSSRRQRNGVNVSSGLAKKERKKKRTFLVFRLNSPSQPIANVFSPKVWRTNDAESLVTAQQCEKSTILSFAKTKSNGSSILATWNGFFFSISIPLSRKTAYN